MVRCRWWWRRVKMSRRRRREWEQREWVGFGDGQKHQPKWNENFVAPFFVVAAFSLSITRTRARQRTHQEDLLWLYFFGARFWHILLYFLLFLPFWRKILLLRRRDLLAFFSHQEKFLWRGRMWSLLLSFFHSFSSLVHLIKVRGMWEKKKCTSVFLKQRRKTQQEWVCKQWLRDIVSLFRVLMNLLLSPLLLVFGSFLP